jgi:hypothetical protein
VPQNLVLQLQHLVAESRRTRHQLVPSSSCSGCDWRLRGCGAGG